MKANDLGNEKIKESFDKLKKGLTFIFKLVPIAGTIFAFWAYLFGYARELGVPTAGLVAFLGALLSLIMHVLNQATLEHNKGYVALSKNKLLLRFVMREIEVVAFSLVAFPAIGIIIDKMMGFEKFLPYPYNWFGLVLFVPALAFILWTLYVFGSKGQGTPVPYEATQHLVIEGPYRMIRNPMEFALSTLMGAIAIILASYFGIILFLYTCLLCHWYTVKLEEPEMEARFGKEWSDYKANVPRWIPKFNRA